MRASEILATCEEQESSELVARADDPRRTSVVTPWRARLAAELAAEPELKTVEIHRVREEGYRGGEKVLYQLAHEVEPHRSVGCRTKGVESRVRWLRCWGLHRVDSADQFFTEGELDSPRAGGIGRPTPRTTPSLHRSGSDLSLK